MEEKIKAKVHRLPSETGVISECIKPYTEERSWSMGELMPYDDGHIDYWQTKHLYITTDEEIKEGDWHLHFYEGKGIIGQSFGDGVSVANESGYRKIIATTDPKLIISISKSMNKDKYPDTTLPQIPQSFIEAYCEQGGINEVLVEVEVEECGIDDGQILYDYDNPILKLNPDNTIIIHPVEEKMYSREEVEDIVEFVVYQMMFKSNVFPSDQKERMKELIKIGIEENL